MLTQFLAFSSAASIIGFDLGTESVLAAVLRSGRSIEMVLNEQSKRKNPAMVSYEADCEIAPENVRMIDRRIGASCSTVMARNRSAVVRSFPEILGKEDTPELREHLLHRYLDFTFDGPYVNGVEPHVSLSMLFSSAVKSAEHQLQDGNIRDAVVAVPSFFTSVQREKVAKAVKLAGLNLLSIIDEKAAISLVYALEKTNFFTREARTVAILDVGAGSTQVSGFKFSAKIVSQKGRNPRPVPKIDELAFVWDDQLGGIDFDVKIAEYLAKKNNLPKVTNALLEDSQKIKHALTLGEIANVSVDSFDHRIIMTRDEFKEICKEPLERFEALLYSLNLTFDSVELVGGATRMPIIQEITQKVLGPISRSLNSDESVVTGAAYTAAMSSGAFRLMDVNMEPGAVHSANLTYGQRNVRLFSEGSSMSKLKTARFDLGDTNEIGLIYTSKLPVGCTKEIGKWSFDRPEDTGANTRLTVSFGFNSHGVIELSKSQVFTKSETGEITQNPLNIKRIYKPLKVSSERRNVQKKLLTAFASNDARIAKIAEARNAMESLVFELRDAMAKDPTWSRVANHDEKEQLNQSILDASKWLDEHTDFEDEKELQMRTRALEEEAKPIRFRVTEDHTREAAVSELEYLLSDIMDAVLKRWPEKKMHVPKTQRKALLNHVKQTREWLERMKEEQNILEPWDEPALKTSEVQLRVNKLGESFRTLEDAILNNKLREHARDENGEEDAFGADL